MGDSNIDLLLETKHTKELCDVKKSFNLKLSSPLAVTREQDNSNPCIDLVYSGLKIECNRVFYNLCKFSFLSGHKYSFFSVGFS